MSFQAHDCDIKKDTLRHSTTSFYQVVESLAHKSEYTDLPLTSFVIWGKLFTISVPQSLNCKVGITVVPTSWVCFGN